MASTENELLASFAATKNKAHGISFGVYHLHGEAGAGAHGEAGAGVHGEAGAGVHGEAGAGVHGEAGAGVHGVAGAGACFKIFSLEKIDLYITDASGVLMEIKKAFPPLSDEDKIIQIYSYRAGLGFVNGSRAYYSALKVAMEIAKDKRFRKLIVEAPYEIMQQISLKNSELVPNLDNESRQLYSAILDLSKAKLFEEVEFRMTAENDNEIVNNAFEASFMSANEAPRSISVVDDFIEFRTLRIEAIADTTENAGAVVLLFPTQKIMESYPVSTTVILKGLGFVSNRNFAIFKAFVLGLRSAMRMGFMNVIVEGDSDLLDSRFESFTMNAQERFLRKSFEHLRFRRITEVDQILHSMAELARRLNEAVVIEGTLAQLLAGEINMDP